jgi:hypothetical protein
MCFSQRAAGAASAASDGETNRRNGNSNAGTYFIYWVSVSGCSGQTSSESHTGFYETSVYNANQFCQQSDERDWRRDVYDRQYRPLASISQIELHMSIPPILLVVLHDGKTGKSIKQQADVDR